MPEPNGACTISERVRLVAPPEGWSVEQYGDYDFYVLEDFILYSFDEREDPERLFHRLDRCTGESTPFPSFTPGMQNPFIDNTPAGRVMYAHRGQEYYVVDRLDEPGDDEPQKIAGLPRPGFLDLNLYNDGSLPYAFFWRDYAVYTHAGDPKAPALRVAEDVTTSVPYPDEILVLDPSTGDVRIVDPFTGASELALTGAQHSHIIDPGESADEARVLWQPLGVEELRIRRIGDGTDVLLTIDPALVDASKVGWWPGSGHVVLFSDSEFTQIVAAVDSETGATIDVPAHVAFDADLLPWLDLTLADGDEVVGAAWNPNTGALHEWYRGPGPAPSLQVADATHADYYVAEQPEQLHPVGSLWRVEFATGERRVIVPRISPWRRPVTGDTELVEFDVGPENAGPRLRDLEYIDVEAGLVTPIAEAVADVAAVPDEGVIWLDAHGAAPGLWVAPLP